MVSGVVRRGVDTRGVPSEQRPVMVPDPRRPGRQPERWWRGAVSPPPPLTHIRGRRSLSFLQLVTRRIDAKKQVSLIARGIQGARRCGARWATFMQHGFWRTHV